MTLSLMANINIEKHTKEEKAFSSFCNGSRLAISIYCKKKCFFETDGEEKSAF
jgi:hypothetical protein